MLERLSFNPAIDRYIHKVYGDLLSGEATTVSVHLRVGYSGEPAAGNLRERGFPPFEYFAEAFALIGGIGGMDSNEENRGHTTYLIFADDIDTAKSQLGPLSDKGYSMVYVGENVVTSVRMMSMCKHHIMTSSTLSFWGAYLDPMQPTGGRTLLHQSFFEQHGKGMIPDDYAASWEVLTTGTAAAATVSE